MRLFNPWFLLAYIVVCLITVEAAYVTTKGYETRILRRVTRERLILFDRYITAKVSNYDVYTRILSENPLVTAFCSHPDADKLEAINKYLSEFNDSVGAFMTYIINKDGLTIAASNYKSSDSLVGLNFAFRDYFKKAIAGQPNGFIAVGTITHIPGYYTTYPVRDGGDITGVFVIKYNLNIFQAKAFEIDGLLLMADMNNVVFTSNDDRYIFHTIGKLPEETLQQIKDSRQYVSEPLTPLPIINTTNEDNATIVTIRWKNEKDNKYNDFKYLMEELRGYKDQWHVFLLAGLSKVNSQIVRNCLYAVLTVTLVFLVAKLASGMALDLRRRKEYEQTITSINEGLELQVRERTQELQIKVDQMLRLEQSLTESEAKYRQLVEMSHEGVWAFNKAGVTTYVNKAVAEMLGFTVEEMTGVRFVEFMDDDARARAAQAGDYQQKQGKAQRLETTLLHRDGSPVHVSVSTVGLMDEKGNFEGSFAIVSDITKRKKMEEKLRESLAEQELLLRELHHRVKNNLQIIAGLVGLQISHVTDESYKNILRDTLTRVQSISLVHEKLYNSETLSQVNIKNYIYSLLKDLFIFFTVDKDKIGIKFEVADVHIGMDTAIPCGLIINELFTNIIKYAFKGRDSGEITIALREEEPDGLELVISDNGVGLPEDVEIGKSKSLGLKVVTILTKQLGGTVEIERGDGTRFILRFKRSGL